MILIFTFINYHNLKFQFNIYFLIVLKFGGLPKRLDRLIDQVRSLQVIKCDIISKIIFTLHAVEIGIVKLYWELFDNVQAIYGSLLFYEFALNIYLLVASMYIAIVILINSFKNKTQNTNPPW